MSNEVISNEVIFQDKKCRRDKCSLNGIEKLHLETLAKLHPGSVAVAVCFERPRFTGCGLEVLGQFTPENAQDLKAIITDSDENMDDQDKS
ncbi:MAG: hypothetical protein ABIR46_02775 [Candidatus Saccharimonadales bacterium]